MHIHLPLVLEAILFSWIALLDGSSKVKSVFKFLFYSSILVAIIFPIIHVLHHFFYGIPIDGLLSSLPYVYLGVGIFYVLGYLLIKYVMKV